MNGDARLHEEAVLEVSHVLIALGLLQSLEVLELQTVETSHKAGIPGIFLETPVLSIFYFAYSCLYVEMGFTKYMRKIFVEKVLQITIKFKDKFFTNFSEKSDIQNNTRKS